MTIVIPPDLAVSQVRYRGEEGRTWIEGLPALAESYLHRWDLRLDGPPWHGAVALALPVRRADGSPAVLKLQPVDDETAGEGAALRAWAGDGAVMLAAWDGEAMLLERLDADRPLSTVADTDAAVTVIASLLGRLQNRAAPPGLRSLSDVVSGMLDAVPQTLSGMSSPDERAALRRWASIVAEVATEPGDRLLHWDLHYDNVLAGEREPWLAIDPKPLGGDPGFELLPALHNRWDELVASGEVARGVRRRFDIMVEVLALPRDRAVAWTLARVLQNCVWEIEDGSAVLDPVQLAVAAALVK